jgi:predicted DNA-binding protein
LNPGGEWSRTALKKLVDHAAIRDEERVRYNSTMTLILELSPEEEARLEAVSKQRGVDPATYAKELVFSHLPATNAKVVKFEAYLNRISRPLPAIPHDKQTREFIYED